jgi:hypothetical protein
MPPYRKPVAKHRKSDVFVRSVLNAARLWQLSNEEACKLFDVPVASWYQMQEGRFEGELEPDQIIRAGIIMALFNNLRLLFSGSRTYRWPKAPNMAVEFGGKSPVDIMIGGGIPAMRRVRAHIEALGCFPKT